MAPREFQPRTGDEAPDALARFLEQHDAPCPSCGYNLRGLRTPRCPECHQSLELRVGIVDAPWAAFLSGACVLAASLGFCVIVMAWGLTQNINKREVAPLLTGILIGSIGILVWTRSRRRVQRERGVGIWFVVLGLLGIALACPCWFLFIVR